MIKYDLENKKVLFDIDQFRKQIEKLSYEKKYYALQDILNKEPLVIKNMKQEMEAQGLKVSIYDDFDFVPLSIVIETLKAIFLSVDFRIKKSYRELNSFVVVAKIVYRDTVIITNKRSSDGIGAKYIKENNKQGQNPMSYDADPTALETSVGIAYSRAIKNAAKKMGNIFGASLNEEEVERKKQLHNEKKSDLLKEVLELFVDKGNKLNKEDHARVKEIITTKEYKSYNKVIKSLKELK